MWRLERPSSWRGGGISGRLQQLPFRRQPGASVAACRGAPGQVSSRRRGVLGRWSGGAAVEVGVDGAAGDAEGGHEVLYSPRRQETASGSVVRGRGGRYLAASLDVL